MAKLPTLPKPGDMVAGRFRILELLGSGGFGTVYRALQENVGREVALKFLTPGVAKDPVNVERFRREAYHVSQLRHPNTITLYDYGQTEEGLIYMVMELLEGTSLADTVQEKGALAWPRAAHVFIQVLKSLSEAHQRGLVHRDLKPENIFLCELFGEQDYVKVLDFGVAKMTMAEDGLESSEDKLTKAGRIFGTPMYMAPEQACAEPITPATDVYALGLLMFEMLTGLPPVTGRNRMDVIHKQIRDPVPELTRELEGTPMGSFIRRATEKRPADRYLDAAEMLDGLYQTLRAMNIQPRALGATHPDISVSTIVPDGLDTAPSDTSSDPDATAAMPTQLAETAARGSLQIPHAAIPTSHAIQIDDAEEHTPDSQPTRPLPPPLPMRPTTSSDETTALPSGERNRLVERSKSDNGFLPRPQSKPRYELPLIGRERDVLKLGGILQEQLFANAGHVVLLEGENGIGKSRVIHALNSNLRNLGIDMAVGYCRRRSMPLESIREALADFWGIAHSERAQIEATLRRELPKLGEYLPAEIDRIADFVRPRGLDEATMTPGSDQANVLFAQLERVFAQIAQRRQLVIVIEDTQYADSATLAFLEYFSVTLRTQSLPIAFILTFRPEERSLNPDLEQSLRTILSNVGAAYTRYVLRRLRGKDLSILLDNILNLEPRLKERIGWLSQGVPLHALQIVRYLQNEGSLVQKKGRWGLKKGSPREIDLPPDLMNLMRLRIEQATARFAQRPSLKSTLEWLATLGMRTPVELLVEIIGGNSASLDEDLSILRDQGIVHQAMHQNMICVEFDNSLLREAILHDLSERWANRRLHQTAAERKLAFYKQRNVEVPLVEIAEHWRQAGDADRYRDTMFAAAQRSIQRQDLRGARDQYRELAVLLEERNDYGELWSKAQISLAELAWKFGEFGLAEDRFKIAIQKGAAKGPELGRAFRGLGHLLVIQGRYSEALEWYKNAHEWARKNHDLPGNAKALIGLSKVHVVTGDLRSEERVSEQLVRMLPSLPPGEISGKVHLHLAEVARRRGSLNKRRDYLIRARQEFEQARDREGLSDTLLALGNALMDPAMNAPDRLNEAGRMFRQALELKKALGDRIGVAEAYRNLGQLEIELGNHEAAESLLSQSLSLHEALGTQYFIAAVHNALGVAFLFRCEFKRAEQHLQQSLEIFKRLGDQIAMSHVLMNLGEMSLNTGDVARAQAMLREARRVKESVGTSWAVYDIRNHLAIVAMWLGEFEDAEKLLEETLRTVDEHGTGEDRAVARSLMGLLRCFQSRLQLAALELGRARADADDLGIDRVTRFCQACAAFYAGLTETESTFQNLIESIRGESFLYTLERTVFLQFMEHLASHTLKADRSRQSARLLHTVGRFFVELGDAPRGEQLIHQAKQLEASLHER
ncbi:MAG: tetratricopeptide repeat protein [bacterium]